MLGPALGSRLEFKELLFRPDNREDEDVVIAKEGAPNVCIESLGSIRLKLLLET